MRVLKNFFLIVLGMIIGLGGLAGTLYLTYTTSKVKTVTDLVGWNDDSIIGSVGKEMVIKDYVAAITDTKKTVGEYEDLLPVITDLLDSVIESEGLSGFISVNKENLLATRVCDLKDSLSLDGDILSISASMKTLDVDLGEMRDYSIFENTYYKTRVMEDIYQEYFTASDFGFDGSKPLYSFNFLTKTVTRVADFDVYNEDIGYFQLSGKCSSDNSQMKYGFIESESKFYKIDDFYSELSNLEIGQSFGYHYDGYFVTSNLIDLNYDGIITQDELDLIAGVDEDYNNLNLIYREHYDSMPELDKERTFFVIDGNGNITCEEPTYSFFMHKEGLYYRPIEDVLNEMGTRFNELYLFEVVSGIEDTELKNFAELSLYDFTNGELTNALGDTELITFLGETMVNGSKILSAISYANGTPGSGNIMVKDLGERINLLTLGDVIDIDGSSMRILQSLKDTEINALGDVRITLAMAIDLDDVDTSKVLKSMKYKKVTEDYTVCLPTYTFGYEDTQGYVYSGLEKVFKFVDECNGTGAKIYNLSVTDFTLADFTYLAEEEQDIYGNGTYYLLTVVREGDNFVTERVETLIDDVGDEIGKVPMSALFESSSNVLVSALLKRGTTIDSLEDDINDLTFNEVYNKDTVWENLAYGNLDSQKPTYLYDFVTDTFTLISSTSALRNYSLSSSYNGNGNLYQIKDDASTWLFILYNEENTLNRNANGDAEKYLSDNAKISQMGSTVNSMSDEIFSSTYQQLYSVGIVADAPASRSVACRTFGEIMAIINN